MEQQDRRLFNRLSVSLLFRCQTLTGEESLPALTTLAAEENPLSSWFADLRPSPPAAFVETDDNGYYRKMSTYLEVVERKISLLSTMAYHPEVRDFFLQQPTALGLSATGISFTVPTAYQPGTILALTLFLPHAALLFSCRGKVLRTTPRETSDQQQSHLIAAQFIDLPKGLEDEISRFLILTERKRLNNTRQNDEKKA
ncbi:MAG: PilZ domain-containing protein [Deltaproteobacteria bacterium]|nr:PilZ domain-containing protein [Candidatus Anaeroferrophillus wilburensis]MBN2888354.1 PilZ domain-containing protein [Deltaproteobacteria bacterium]